MNYKLLAFDVSVVFAVYLIIIMPFAFATNVNIIFNGVVEETTQIDSKNIVNKQIVIKHDPFDVTWTNVRVSVNVNSASMAHTVERIYLYKCKKLSPKECVQMTPLDFETYVDTELAWSDISVREGITPYPEVANLLILVKLEDLDGKVSWVGFFDIIKRTNYNVFNQYSTDLENLDLYAESLDFVEPIKTYIENYQMIPFEWLTKAVFKTAEGLHAIGSSSVEIEQPTWQTAALTKNEITTIGKDYYFIFSKKANTFTNPITLNINPSFTCGDEQCESNLGETQINCCYDCGCPDDYYCDTTETPAECRDASKISLTILPVPAQTITDCSQESTLDITARINNPPAGMAETIGSYVTIDEIPYSVSCTKVVGSTYTCPVNIQPKIECGISSYSTSSTLNMTITYNDGADTVSKELSGNFNINLNYDCLCSSGYYCDINELTCKQDIVSLSVPTTRSLIRDYTPGDKISLLVQINNPPTGMVVDSVVYTIGNITYDSSSIPGESGTPDCFKSQNVYNCSIQLFIPNYNYNKRYVIRDNSIAFSISWPDGSPDRRVTKTLTSSFSDITIPSRECGDEYCSPGETQENCCSDCGCTNDNYYCDLEKGCRLEGDIGLSIVSLDPKNFHDCDKPHLLDITAKISNIPSDANIVSYYYILGDEVKTWSIDCEEPNTYTGTFECQLRIPPIEECTLPYHVLGPNALNVTVTFTDNYYEGRGQIIKEYKTSFDDVTIVPVYYCGDGVCESDLGESASVCCIDCSCKDDPLFGQDYYCDYDVDNPNGTCSSKSDIRLVVDTPKTAVRLDSCEVPHEVNVKAHLENQPSRAYLISSWSVLNGSRSEYFYCYEEKGLGLNATYNCTVRIPQVYPCKERMTYVYEPNSISMLIGFDDGRGRRVTQQVSSPYERITITQHIRSLQDIMDESMFKLQKELADTMDIINNLVKWINICMKVTIILAIASIAAMIIVPTVVSDGTTLEKIRATADVSVAAFAIWSKICEIIQSTHRIDLEVQYMQMEIIRTEECIERNQHMLDAGLCERQEYNCFERMKNCIRFGEMEGYLDGIQKGTNVISSNMQDIGKSFSDIGEALEEGFEPVKDVSLAVLLEDGIAVHDVCQFDGIESYYYSSTGEYVHKCKITKIKIDVDDPKNRCKPFVFMDKDTLDETQIKYIGATKEAWHLSFGSHILTLFCDRNRNNILDEREEKEVVGKTQITVHEGDKETCDCPGLRKRLEISAINVISITDTTATIQWKTNMPSNSKVDYWWLEDSNKKFGKMEDKYYFKKHEIKLTGLKPNTEYHYRVSSKDKNDNLEVSDERTFTTLTNGETPTAEEETKPSYTGMTCYYKCKGKGFNNANCWSGTTASNCHSGEEYANDANSDIGCTNQWGNGTVNHVCCCLNK